MPQKISLALQKCMYNVNVLHHYFCGYRFATVMQQCWESDPDKRPTFSQLTVAIDAIATAMTGYMKLSAFSDESDEYETVD